MCGIYGVINRKVRREQAMECLDTMIPVSYTHLTLPTIA